MDPGFHTLERPVLLGLEGVLKDGTLRLFHNFQKARLPGVCADACVWVHLHICDVLRTCTQAPSSSVASFRPFKGEISLLEDPFLAALACSSWQSC